MAARVRWLLALVLVSFLAQPGRSRALIVGSAQPLPVRMVWLDASSPYYVGQDQWRPLFWDAAVATDGVDFLVVWTEGPHFADVHSAWAQRIDGAGRALDPEPIHLFDGPADQISIAYAQQSGSYLIAWTTYGSEVVSAARLDGQGRLLPPGPFPVGRLEAPPDLYSYVYGPFTSVASDGAGFVVFFEDKAVNVAADAVVSAPTSTGLMTWRAAADGQGYMAVGRPASATTGAAVLRLSRQGAPLGDPVALEGVVDAAIAFDGQDFLVTAAWLAPESLDPPSIVSLRVEPSGQVAGPGVVLWSNGPDAVLGEPYGPFSYRYTGAVAASFDGRYSAIAFGYFFGWPEYAAAGFAAARDGATWSSTPPVYLGWTNYAVLEVASNASGRSLVLSDGLYYLPPAYTHAPVATVMTTWAALSVRRSGSGAGAVVSSPAGLSCGGVCMAQFDAPTEVTLAAVADAGSVFKGWSGACAGSDPSCTVTTDAAKEVGAAFEATHFALTVSATGQGAGRVLGLGGGAAISCTASSASGCSALVPKGSWVLLVASWDPRRAQFKGWTGACSGVLPLCLVQMNRTASAAARFEPRPAR